MATEDDDAAIARRVRAAVEAGPAPDRGRLARIEQGLPVHPARGRGARARALVLALGIGGAAGAVAAGYWLVAGRDDTGPSPAAAQPGADRARPVEEREAGGRAGPAEGGAPAQEEGPVIYQR